MTLHEMERQLIKTARPEILMYLGIQMGRTELIVDFLESAKRFENWDLVDALVNYLKGVVSETKEVVAEYKSE